MAAFMNFLVLLVFPAAISAATITVGSSSGWTLNYNYANWASGQTFSPGDSLVFNYGPSHAVSEVSQSDYDNCNAGNAISTDSNSPTTVSLTSPGTRYFLCPTPTHCSQGMKLAVTVSGGSASSPSGQSSPSGPSSPSGSAGTPGSVAPSTANPSSPPPPPPAKSAAKENTAGWKTALFLLAATTLFGLMG